MRLRIGTLFGCAGWFLAVLLACLILSRIWNRIFLKLPSVQREQWVRVMADKKSELALPWRDERPLIVLAGDSHIEMGDWYDTFGGAFAMRNCGLSRAKIEDVCSLVSALGDRNPEAVILMCGFNNLARNDSVESALNHYQELLSITQATLHPGKILVLSVMPLQVSPVDKAGQAINQKIAFFNRQLETICSEHHAVFVNVNPAVMDADGSLLPSLAIDGLHLNQAGYEKIAIIIRTSLKTRETQK
jgi:hypothetical protein